jgi:hypothetical protein
MYTKEDIEKAKQYLDNEGYGTGSNFTLNMVANLMAEYAAKNCVIPAVVGRSEQLRAFKQFLKSEYHLPVSNRMVDEFEQKQSS